MTQKKVVPTSYEEMIQTITVEYDGLSKKLKQIASYALDNPNEFAINTIAEIAKRADAQPSALVRFAKVFGFDGFTELQKLFQQRLLKNNPSYETRLNAVRASGKNTPYGLLTQFTEANTLSLQHLLQEIRPESLAKAVGILDKAETIFVFAMGRTYPLAAYLYYSIASIGHKAQLIDNAGGLHASQVRQIGKDDALLVASFDAYTPYVSEAATEMHANGVPVIAITDHQLSPLTNTSSVCFHVSDASVHDFRSLTASMCLAQTLVVGLGVANKA